MLQLHITLTYYPDIIHLHTTAKFEGLPREVCEWEVAGRNPNRRQVFLTRFHDFTQYLDADVGIQHYVRSRSLSTSSFRFIRH